MIDFLDNIGWYLKCMLLINFVVVFVWYKLKKVCKDVLFCGFIWLIIELICKNCKWYLLVKWKFNGLIFNIFILIGIGKFNEVIYWSVFFSWI